MKVSAVNNYNNNKNNNCAPDNLQPPLVTGARYLRENRLRLVVFVPPVCEKRS